MRPTTKDLAKAAGVSLATVDRVLNERAGVRKKTVEAVNKAVKEIGFVRNYSAANLARGKIHRFCFLLPQSGDLFIDAILERISEASSGFSADGIEVESRRIHNTDPHQIARTLSQVDPNDYSGVAILAPESPQVRDAISRLKEKSVEVVNFLSGRSNLENVDFVGIDNRAAGATAARLIGRFSKSDQGKVLVIAETMNARDSLERRLGFDAILTADYPGFTALPSLETYGDPERTSKVIRNAMLTSPDISAIYIISSEARATLVALENEAASTSHIVVAHERTCATEEALRSGQLDAVIAQNPGHLVRSAIRMLRSRCEKRQILSSQEEIRIEILLKENLNSYVPIPRSALGGGQ